jgi:hypothetical protein
MRLSPYAASFALSMSSQRLEVWTCDSYTKSTVARFGPKLRAGHMTQDSVNVDIGRYVGPVRAVSGLSRGVAGFVLLFQYETARYRGRRQGGRIRQGIQSCRRQSTTPGDGDIADFNTDTISPPLSPNEPALLDLWMTRDGLKLHLRPSKQMTPCGFGR